MYIMESISLFLILLVTPSIMETQDYAIFEVTAFNDHEREILYKIHILNESVVFLNGVTNEAALTMQIIVKDCCTKEFLQYMQKYGIEHTQVQFDSESKITKNDDFIKWHSINAWITTRQKKSSIMKLVISRTYEQREIFALSWSQEKIKPAVVITGGEQGFDWMSPAIIFSLADKFSTETSLTILNYFDFYLFPILNPDGYVYSMNMDQFWPKNRREFFPPKQCPQKKTAIGVNINRNWYFGKINSQEIDECNSVYLGHKSLSEEEPKALSKFLNKNAANLMAFINIVGYGGKLITLPYSSPEITCNNCGVVMEMIMSACERLYEKFHVTYFYGSTAKYFYNNSGNSADWVKSNLNVPVVYTVYLNYDEGFLPQSKHINILSEQLRTIVQDTLMISKEIYGPLFNKQTKIENNLDLIVTPIYFLYIIIIINA